MKLIKRGNKPYREYHVYYWDDSVQTWAYAAWYGRVELNEKDMKACVAYHKNVFHHKVKVNMREVSAWKTLKEGEEK